MKLYRNIAIIVAVIALLITGMYFITKYNPEENNSGDTTENEKTEMFNIYEADSENITRIKIKNADEEYEIKKSKDLWILNNNPSIKLQNTAISTYLHTCSSISAKKVVSESDENAKEYGFDENSLYAELFFKDGKTDKVLVGNKSLDGSNYYIKLSGEPKIYLKNAYGTESIIPSSNSFRDLSIVKFDKENYSVLEEIYIEKAGNTPVRIKKLKRDNSERQYQFKLIEPVYSDVSQEVFTDNIVETLSNVTADAVVNDNTNDLSAYGFDKPYAKFSVKTDTLSKNVIVGGETESYRFLKEQGSNTIYAVKKQYLEFLNVSYIDLMSKLIHIEYIDTIENVEIVSGNTKYIMMIKDADQKEYYINDKKVEKKLFTSLYQEVIGLSLESIDLSKEPNVTADGYIKYTRKDGSVSKVEFLPINELNYRVTVDGKGNSITNQKNFKDIFVKFKETLDTIK